MAVQNLFGDTKAERETHFLFLYKKVFPGVAKYISNNGGCFDEAKDIFQDALVVLYEKSATQAIESEQAYLMGISKKLWARRFKSKINCASLDDDGHDFDFIEEDEVSPQSAKLNRYLETAGQKCLDILKAFYYDNLPVVKVAELFGFAGTHSATVQKYKCMEKVREIVKEKSLAYEDFIE